MPEKVPPRRPLSTSRTVLTMLVALWLMLATNLPFWRTVWQGVGGLDNDNPLFLLSLPLFVWLWLFGLLSLLAWGRATRAVLGALMLLAATASYFIHSYGVLIDGDMLANVLQTDRGEALELVNGRMLLWIGAFGVLPVLLLGRVRLVVGPWRRELALKLGSIAFALAGIGGIVLSLYQPYASLVRNHRELRLLLTPSNLVGAVHSYASRQLQAPATLQVVGADAHRVLPAGGAGKPRLTVLVVGETARAANFSLNGYGRPTNPELAAARVVSFTEVRSCGTATATSVPCMFLDVGRDGYRDAYAKSREGLLDVLQRAGVAVLWRDNNSGCKGACDRVPSEDIAALQLPELCRDGACHDEALLVGLQDYLDRLERDAVVVLHMKGSHGPAYFKRYPPAFARFAPACADSQLDRCTPQSIVNAYDNSLLYTDHVLKRTIELLERNAARFDTAMLYLSDHGESLGENGIYLHGLPYAMAPDEQKHIPMILWLSEGLQRREGIRSACLEKRRTAPLSHDNLFHSVLGLMDVRTDAYQPQRDLFRPCRPEGIALAGEGDPARNGNEL